MVCGDDEIMISFCAALFSFDCEKYSRGSFVMQRQTNLRAGAQHIYKYMIEGQV